MTKYITYKISSIAKTPLKDKINAWCEKNKNNIKTGYALDLCYSVKIDTNKDNVYKLKLINTPKNLFNIIISPSGIINEEFYKHIIPDHHELFSNIFNSHLAFVELLAKGIVYPDKYPNISNFISDFNNKLFTNNDERLVSALNFLMTPVSEYSYIKNRSNNLIYYYSDIHLSERIIIENIDVFKQLNDNINLVFEILENYDKHSLIKLIKLQRM